MRFPAWLLFGFFGFLCQSSPVASAGNLDQPGAKKITVRSEIKRGYDVVSGALDTGLSASVLITDANMMKPIKANEQAGTDSPGFLLGAYYAAWDHLTQLLKDAAANETDDPASLETCRRGAARDHDAFRRLEKELGLEDAELYEALEFKTPAAADERLKRWEADEASAQAALQARRDRELQEQQRQQAAQKEQEAQELRRNLPRLVKESQARALQKYPALGWPDSPLNKRFLMMFETLRAVGSERLERPDWPEKLADECAAQP